MPLTSIIKVALVFTMTLCATILRAQSKADTVTVQAIIQDEDIAWNKGDATAYSRQFADEGTFTNIAGMFFTGHKAFLERHGEIFKGIFSKTTLQQKIVSFRFIRPEVAILETLCRVTGFSKEGLPARIQLDTQGRLYTRLVQVVVKEAGEWKIVVYHNVDLKPGGPVPE